MKFLDRVKKDLQIAVKESAELFKEGTGVLSTEARRMATKGAATARKGATAAATEAGRLTRVANLRLQLFHLNQRAQDKFAEIGGRVYELAVKNPKGLRLDETTRKRIQEAEQIEGQIKKLKSEIGRSSKK